LSLWYLFEEQVLKGPQKDCIWSRTGCYTRIEVYEQCCRYANWFLSQGVEPGQWVAVRLQNCPEFMFLWMALWSIGCAPALLNCNLEGESLLHTLKYSNSSLVLVDVDLSERITKLQDTIVGDLKMRIVFLNDIFKI
jgi:acyl-CoA synthetase (AMP-forming)/AMP-acid ligase II